MYNDFSDFVEAICDLLDVRLDRLPHYTVEDIRRVLQEVWDAGYEVGVGESDSCGCDLCDCEEYEQ